MGAQQSQESAQPSEPVHWQANEPLEDSYTFQSSLHRKPSQQSTGLRMPITKLLRFGRSRSNSTGDARTTLGLDNNYGRQSPHSMTQISVQSALPRRTRSAKSADTDTSVPATTTTGSASASASDSDYIWMDGRKYHNALSSSYIFPCDEKENERLHRQHFIVRLAIQGNYLAPVSDMLRKGAKVLDVACGPGSWTMEIASEYPKSKVIGIDISGMYPQDIKPPNCMFLRCDITEGIPFADATFDYVFMRFVSGGVTTNQWKSLCDELTRLVKPGGWIEMVEMEPTLQRPGPNLQHATHYLLDTFSKHNLNGYVARQLGGMLRRQEGMTGVTERFISIPGGQWAGNLGQLTLQSWMSFYDALRPQICQSTGVSADEYDKRLQACWAEVDEHQTFQNVYFAYGQKKVA